MTAHYNYGNSTRTYAYDTLGNLTYETGNGSHNTDYRFNNLNQEVNRSTDDWKTCTASTYDDRGNLIPGTYHIKLVGIALKIRQGQNAHEKNG